jgi:hypothetical protein
MGTPLDNDHPAQSAESLHYLSTGYAWERLLAATLFAHEPATFGEHGSAGLYDHGGPLAASMSTISPG